MFDYETIVISLPVDENRRKEVQKEFEDARMDFRFFDAVDGRKLDQTPSEYDQKTRKQRYVFDLTPGEIGCFLSHREVWKTCIRQQKIFLVLEDDFKINCNLSQVLRCISMMKEHWGLIRLHGIRKKILSGFQLFLVMSFWLLKNSGLHYRAPLICLHQRGRVNWFTIQKNSTFR
jgi:glycosyl transferase family 25